MTTAFRFSQAAGHVYTVDGVRVPSITQVLKYGGFGENRFYTPEGRERGTQVHELSAQYDLGALPNPRMCTSPFKGYLLAHVAAMAILRPEILAVEQAVVHTVLRFGGRPDRVVRASGLAGVLEVKTSDPEPWHALQTSLQAILVAPRLCLAPEALVRLCLYLKPDGRFRVVEHKAAGDFLEARRMIAASRHREAVKASTAG